MKIAKVIRDYPIPGPVNHWFKAGDTLTNKLVQDLFVNDEHFSVEESEVKRHPHFFEISEVPDGPWKPKAGEGFAYIGGSLITMSAAWTENTNDFHRALVDGGNYFLTKAEAESKIASIRNALAGRSLKDVLDGIVKDNQVFVAPSVVREILARWESAK